MKTFLFGAFSFAFLASVGNALFVYAQKKSVPSSSPFLFLIFSLIAALITLSVVSIFLPKDDVYKSLSDNFKWAWLCGTGIAITYIGFYFLYSRFGATYYILYAILSFITTSIIVGIVILKEHFNVYYILSMVCAIVTLFLFYLGKQQS